MSRKLANSGDEVVTVAMSFFADADCAHPIRLELGDPLVLEFDVDSSEKYEHCRREGNHTGATYYEFWCDGDRISGKILCEDDTCSKCKVDSSMHDAQGHTILPYGEMLLDTCLPLPSDNATWLRFHGECPPKGSGNSAVIIISIVCSLVAIACLILGIFLWRKRRESQSRWYTSGPSTSATSSYSPPLIAGV